MSQIVVLVIAIATAVIGFVTGYFVTRLIVRSTLVAGVLYVDDSEPGDPVIYTTLSEDLHTYRNGALKLFLVRKVK